MLSETRRLVLVRVPTMASSSGALLLFERDGSESAWHLVHPAEPVVLGVKGTAWGNAFRHLARPGEPIKREGDGRTPAGIYPIGRPFGFSASPRDNYLRITAGLICVHDPASPAYNTITSRAIVGRKVRGENMRAISLYRQGLVIGYPTDAAARAGSCIFIHVWQGPTRGTAGCLALPEQRVVALQEFAAQHRAAVAIIPELARERFGDCLPRIDAEQR
ncbi:MAG: hypothetical protein R3D62_22720 [Xanthobacteraceae bacterium]